MGKCWIISLWPSDAIWRQRSGSTLAQVIGCRLTAPSHYLHQCWLIVSANELTHCIVPLILIFWDVNEKHFTYAGFDHFSILISFYQLCWSYIFIFVLWDLHGKDLIFPHMCLVTMNQQNSGTNGLIGVRQAYDEESVNWYYEGYMCNQWLAVTMITRYCMFWMYVW